MKPAKRIASSAPLPSRRPPKRQSPAEFRELQNAVAALVMRPLTAAEGMRPVWTDGRSTAQVVARLIKPNKVLSSFERLEIYNRQYWFRVLECFGDDYPGLNALLGDKTFRQLAVAYLEKHPSQSFTLRNLGRHLVAFIRAQPALTAPHQAVALDMARLEWAHIEAFDSAAETVLNADDLLGLSPAKVRLRLQPYVALLRLDHAVDDYLLAIKRKETDALRQEASNAVSGSRSSRRKKMACPRLAEPIYVAVHRYRDSVYYKRLSADEYGVLQTFAAGQTLEVACTVGFEPDRHQINEWSQAVRRWFETWTGLGWFCQGTNASAPQAMGSSL